MSESTQAQIVAFEDDARVSAEESEDAIRALHEAERIAEAIVFASAEPVPERVIADKLPDGTNVKMVMKRLAGFYGLRGVNLLRVSDNWAFRTAADLSFLIHRDQTDVRKLSRAALEVLSIIAYHQAVTRAEIEEIRGVATSRGTLDVLLESGWIKMRGDAGHLEDLLPMGQRLNFLIILASKNYAIYPVWMS